MKPKAKELMWISGIPHDKKVNVISRKILEILNI